jgi:biopolymer transport protein ExbD
MRVPTRTRELGVTVNITSLIDVIFLLIIFFLAASHFGRTSSTNLPDLPEAVSGEPITKNPLSLDVNVYADGKLLLGESEATIDQIRAALKDGFAKHGADFGMYVNGDRGATYGQIKPLLQMYQEVFLEAIGKREVTGLNFSVLKP